MIEQNDNCITVHGVMKRKHAFAAGEFSSINWQPIQRARLLDPGTHILAVMVFEREGKPFTEIREIFWREMYAFGLFLPWHAGEPDESNDGFGSDHFGVNVPRLWMPLYHLPPHNL